MSSVIIDPCPKPPMCGLDVHIRIKKFEIFVREEDLNFLTAFRLEVQQRTQYLQKIGVMLAKLAAKKKS